MAVEKDYHRLGLFLILAIIVILGTVLSGVLAITLTPLFGFLAILMIASSVRGASNGMSQPLIMSSVLRAVSPDSPRGRAW